MTKYLKTETLVNVKRGFGVMTRVLSILNSLNSASPLIREPTLRIAETFEVKRTHSNHEKKMDHTRIY